MVLVAPGVYDGAGDRHDAVHHDPRREPQPTIIDGGFERANGIQVIEADGVVIQNLTARNELLNGFYWNRVHGYWGSYLTAYNNGDYGIFAYDSVYGQFDHSYASGSPDSGLLHRAVRPVPRGDHRRDLDEQRGGVLGDERRRRPRDREQRVVRQPRRDRARTRWTRSCTRRSATP